MNNPPNLANGFPILGGRQGLASGAASGAVSYYAGGLVGTVDADELQALESLLGTPSIVSNTATATLPSRLSIAATAVPRNVATATLRLSLGSSASSTPRVTGAASLPIALGASTIATPRVTASATLPLSLSTSSVATIRVTATASLPLAMGGIAAGTPRLTAAATLPLTLGASGTTILRVPGTATIRFTLGLSATAEVKWSGLISPTVTLAATWSPSAALAVPAIDVRLNSGGAVPSLYFDNDADLVVKKLPAAAEPTWLIAADADSNTPIHATLSGALTYNSTTQRHTATVEGNAITAHLADGDVVHLVVRWGQNVRYVVKDITVSAVRPD